MVNKQYSVHYTCTDYSMSEMFPYCLLNRTEAQ